MEFTFTNLLSPGMASSQSAGFPFPVHDSSTTPVPPTGFSCPISTAGSHPQHGTFTTEFTKRKNWSHSIINELHDLYHVIAPTGKILYVSPSSLEVVGYAPEELIGRDITEFIHIDDVDMFIRDLHASLEEKELRLFYRFRKKDDKFLTLEITGRPYFGLQAPGLPTMPPFSADTDSLAMFPPIAGPGPSGSAPQAMASTATAAGSLRGSSLDTLQAGATAPSPLDISSVKCFFTLSRPYPSKALGMLDTFLELKMENELLLRRLREYNIDNETVLRSLRGSNTVGTASDTASRRVSLEELRTITELSRSGSADTRSIPTLFEGTAEPDSLSRARRKKSRLEPEEYVCTDCGTVESPEWRKGPFGPKTLCNACGLRWAKKSRKPDQTQQSPPR